MSRRNLLTLIATLVVSLLCYDRAEQAPYARYLLEGYEKIDRLALQQLPEEELFAGAMQGMVNRLWEHGDQHSQFITPREAQLFQQELSQEIGGIGVRLSITGDPPALTVSGPPMPGRPADRAGIRQGDQIVAIDGQQLTPELLDDLNHILERMRGQPSEPLELTIRHEGSDEPLQLRLVREKLTLDSLRGDRLLPDQSWDYVLQADPRIALVRITSFGNLTVNELQTLLPALLAQGVQAIILDLRGNPGGPIDAAIETCELFLPADKVIVETRGRHGRLLDAARSRGAGAYVDLPLATLVDRYSASASEIVAGCLQDHRRSVIVGERSFGKGTVQQILPMQASRSLLKLTMASFWRPSGQNIHRPTLKRDPTDPQPWGVRPDADLGLELTDEQFVQLQIARAQRDRAIYDPATTNQAPSVTEPADSDDLDPIALFLDDAVDLAVAHLQEQLDR